MFTVHGGWGEGQQTRSARGSVQRVRTRAQATVVRAPRAASTRTSWGKWTPSTPRYEAATRARRQAIEAHHWATRRTIAVATAKAMVAWWLGETSCLPPGHCGSGKALRQGRSWASRSLNISLDP